MRWKFNLGILAIGAVIFASCSSNDDLFDPEKAALRKEAQYTVAFVKQYGEIAADQDWGFGEKPTTRGTNPNSNEWSNYVVVPGDITAAEKDAVTEWFNTHQNPESTTSVNWSDFFVQHVSSAHSNMDHLIAVLENGTDDHIYNFNASDGSIMLMQNSGTSSFGYLNSLDSKNHYKYTVQYINGSYYVGFDFEATGGNSNQQEAADGYYNDWIVKICPATYKNAQRIIAEDLGASDDFDFNDVVFDVALLSDATVITLRAAGGTLPLYIGNHEYEVHKLFGVPTSTMVNTGLDTEKKEVVIFRLPKCNAISDVRILVENTAAGEYYLKANCGEAPQMICVPTTYEWTEERQAIDEKYPKFREWVGNTAVDWLN